MRASASTSRSAAALRSSDESDELAPLRDALARAHATAPHSSSHSSVFPESARADSCGSSTTRCDSDPAPYVAWRQGRSLPYGEGVAFWALGEMTKAQARSPGERRRAGGRSKAPRRGRWVIPDEVGEARWVEGHLRPLAGLGGGARRAAIDATEAFAAWRRFFEAIAESTPLILVFEDLHWADDDLLDFVDQMADWTTDVPLLLLCTARPELLDRTPRVGRRQAERDDDLAGAALRRTTPVELVSSLLANGLRRGGPQQSF